MQQLRNIHFHEADNDQIIAYSKVDALTGNTVLIVVNLDPRSAREATVRLDLGALGLEAGAQFEVRDAITGSRYLWSETNFVRLEPLRDVAHIFVLPELPASSRERLAWREIKTYRA